MSQNPYTTTRIGGDDFSGMPAPSRMSVLAVIALVCGILGCLPGLSLLAIIMGVAAIFLISGSKGRVRGTGLAIGGVVLGLIFTGIWVLFAIGVVTFAQQVQQTIIVPAQTALKGLEQGDRAAIRKMLSTTASPNISDAQIDQFATDVKAEFGAFKTLPDSLGDLYEAWKRAGQAMGQAQSQGQNQQFNNMIPWPAEFDKGQGLLLLEVDPRSGGNMQFSNIGVARPDMSKEIWLYPRPASGSTSFPAPTPGSSTPTPPPPSPAPGDAPDEKKDPATPPPPGGG